MPYELTWEAMGVINRFSGFVTGADLVCSMEVIASDPRFDDLRFVISDRREMQGNSIGPQDLERAAAIRIGSMATNPNIRVLVVASESELVAVNDALQRPPLIGSRPTYTFADMASARNWLAGVPHLNNPRPWFGTLR